MFVCFFKTLELAAHHFRVEYIRIYVRDFKMCARDFQIKLFSKENKFKFLMGH